MIGIGPLQFASPWVLLLLLALPVWWWMRRRRRPPAIVFSRVPTLLKGPRAGRGIAILLTTLRNVALIGFIVALGLLVDTFLIRVFLVPSIALLLGSRSI